jgi:two-component system, chemotaxis family, sensor kinase CheA
VDVAKYKALFIEQSREHLTELSRLLVAIEGHTDPAPIIDDIFRHVHSIKGMSASMGYEPIVTLAHRIEDVAGVYRRDKRAPDKATVDLILKGVDGLTSQVAAVAAGESVRDFVEVVEALGLAKQSGGTAPAESVPKPVAPVGPVPGATRLVRVRVAEDCKSVAVRLFTVHRQLSGIGKVTQSTPTLEDIRSGQVSAREAAFELSSECRDEAIVKLVAAIPEIALVHVEQPTTARPVRETKNDRPSVEEAAKASSTVRVRTDILDNLIDNVGELFILRQRLESLLATEQPAELRAALDQLSVRIREMRDQVMTVRMTPMRTLTDRYPRLVRDLARSLGKDVELVVEGDQIELDRAVLDNLDEPFIHTLRNAVDHGIEAADERKRRGKPTAGKVRVVASRDRDTVLVVIEDDGRGLDAAALKERALKLGLLLPKQAEEMTQRDAYFLVCIPGFSTKSEVSDVSGRGVGMDVVRSKIEALGGTLDIESEPGVCTRFILRLPLTVAIINVLLVESCRRVFALPVTKVVAVRETGDDTIQEAGGTTYLSFRHALAPVISLGELLRLDVQKRPAFAVVLEDGRDLVAVAVERVVGYHEVVVKPLGDPLDRLEWFSGATILGDGRPILILDLPKAIRARLAA